MKQGWEIKKLGEVCEVLNGFAFKSDKYVEKGTRIIRITNVQKGLVVDDEPKFYSDEDMTGLNQYQLYENDLLMSLTGNVGRVGLLTKEMLPAALNQRVACLRIKNEKTNIRYLFHYLNSSIFEQEAILSASGIAQKNMSTEWLKKHLLPVPPLPEQEKIVSELDCLSGLIEKKRQQLKELDALAQSIFYEMFGNPVENERGWEVKKIENLFKVTSSKRILQSEWQNEGVPFYKVADIVALAKGCNVKAVTFIKESTYNDLEISNLVPKEDDILITSRGTLGECYIVKKTDKFYFQDGMITWLTNKDRNISSVFVKVLFSNAIFLEYMIGVANSSTVAYLSIKQLSQLKLPLPPLPLQQTFAQKVEAIEKQKELIKQSIIEAETLLASRMQYYFEEG